MNVQPLPLTVRKPIMQDVTRKIETIEESQVWVAVNENCGKRQVIAPAIRNYSSNVQAETIKVHSDGGNENDGQPECWVRDCVPNRVECTPHKHVHHAWLETIWRK